MLRNKKEWREISIGIKVNKCSGIRGIPDISMENTI